jgi:hypothetical protein
MISRLCNNFVTPGICGRVPSRGGPASLLQRLYNNQPITTGSLTVRRPGEEPLVEKYTQDTGGGGSDFTFGWDLMRYVQLGSATQNACTSGGNGP